MLDRVKGLFGSKRRKGALLPGDKLSKIGALSRDVKFLAAKTERAENQRSRFNTAICLLSLSCAESLIRGIEQQDQLLMYYDGTSRDVLLYEAFIGNYLMLGRLVYQTSNSEWAKAFTDYGSGSVDTAAAAAGNVIASGRHRPHLISRTMELGSGKSVLEMAENLSARLLRSQGKQQVEESDHPNDGGIEWLQASIGLPAMVMVLTNNNLPAAGDVMKNLFTAYYVAGGD